MATLRQRAFREGWEQHTLWMVAIGEMTADEVFERARIREGAQKLRRLPQEQWPPFQVRWDLSVEARPYAAV
jgi:hypothetical protein